MAKLLLSFTFFTCMAFLASAQQLYFGFGNTNTIFNYKNSQGEKLDNLQADNNYYLEAGYKIPVWQSKFKISPSLQFNRYGASGSSPGYFYRWDLSYLALNAGVEYEILHLTDFFSKGNGFVKDRQGLFMYLKGTFSGELMINGQQQINENLYNLSGVEQFDTPYFFARGGLGINYAFSEDIAVYAQYMGGMSLPILSGNDDGNEQLRLITHQVGFGFLIGFSR